MENLDQELLNIQVTSQITGLNSHTIRAWEKRYSVVTPDRDARGRRLYNPIEISRLQLLKQLVDKGNSISELAQRDEESLEQLYSKLYGKSFASDETIADEHENLDIQDCLNHVLFGIKYFNLNIISHELQKARTTLSTERYLIEVITPVINEVRNLRAQQVLTEHQKIAIYFAIKLQMDIKLCSCLDNNLLEGQKILLASPGGKLNELSLMQTSILLQARRTSFNYLGTNIAAEILVEFATQLRSKLVILSVGSTPNQSAAELKQFLSYLDENMPKGVQVWLSGPKETALINNVGKYEYFSSISYLADRVSLI